MDWNYLTKTFKLLSLKCFNKKMITISLEKMKMEYLIRTYNLFFKRTKWKFCN